MRRLAWAPLLVACGGAPSPAPATSDAPPADACAEATPDLATLEAWLRATGAEPVRADDVLRLAVPGAHGPISVVVQPMPDDRVVWLTTEPLIALKEADGDRGIALLLTSVAVLNYETLEGKLQLDPKSGGVLLSLELPTDDGLGRATFVDAVATLARNADALLPRLREAAGAKGL